MQSRDEAVFLTILAVILWLAVVASSVLCLLGLSTIEDRGEEIACASIGIVFGVMAIVLASKEKMFTPIKQA